MNRQMGRMLWIVAAVALMCGGCAAFPATAVRSGSSQTIVDTVEDGFGAAMKASGPYLFVAHRTTQTIFAYKRLLSPYDRLELVAYHNVQADYANFGAQFGASIDVYADGTYSTDLSGVTGATAAPAGSVPYDYVVVVGDPSGNGNRGVVAALEYDGTLDQFISTRIMYPLGVGTSIYDVGFEFGRSVAIFNAHVYVGAPGSNSNKGRGFVFRLLTGAPGNWGFIASYMQYSTRTSGDRLCNRVTATQENWAECSVVGEMNGRGGLAWYTRSGSIITQRDKVNPGNAWEYWGADMVSSSSAAYGWKYILLSSTVVGRLRLYERTSGTVVTQVALINPATAPISMPGLSNVGRAVAMEYPYITVGHSAGAFTVQHVSGSTFLVGVALAISSNNPDDLAIMPDGHPVVAASDTTETPDTVYLIGLSPSNIPTPAPTPSPTSSPTPGPTTLPPTPAPTTLPPTPGPTHQYSPVDNTSSVSCRVLEPEGSVGYVHYNGRIQCHIQPRYLGVNVTSYPTHFAVESTGLGGLSVVDTIFTSAGFTLVVDGPGAYNTNLQELHIAVRWRDVSLVAQGYIYSNMWIVVAPIAAHAAATTAFACDPAPVPVASNTPLDCDLVFRDAGSEPVRIALDLLYFAAGTHTALEPIQAYTGINSVVTAEDCTAEPTHFTDYSAPLYYCDGDARIAYLQNGTTAGCSLIAAVEYVCENTVPTAAPTPSPTHAPTSTPTPGPTRTPTTASPTASPTPAPTSTPTTAGPTHHPTPRPPDLEAESRSNKTLSTAMIVVLCAVPGALLLAGLAFVLAWRRPYVRMD